MSVDLKMVARNRLLIHMFEKIGKNYQNSTFQLHRLRIYDVHGYMLTSEQFKSDIKVKISLELDTFSNVFLQNQVGFTEKDLHKAILDL